MTRVISQIRARVGAKRSYCAGRQWRRLLTGWMLCAFGALFVRAQAVPVGSLLVTVRQTAHLTFAFENGTGAGSPGTCSITGAGTSSATLNLGTASIVSDNQTCVTYSAGTNGSSYTLGNTIYVRVTKSGNSATYTLSAKLGSAAPTGVQWSADSNALSTTASTLTTTGAYGSNIGVNLSVTVQHSVTTSNLGQTIDFTATAN